MALEMQNRVCDLVQAVHGGRVAGTPTWLIRPGRHECGFRWPAVRRIYAALERTDLPEVAPSSERRTVDLVLVKRGQLPRIIEVDESQHFNAFRALTIRAYPRTARVAFDRRAWLHACDTKARLEGGGFAKPRPPLFPGENGRHRQRAFRDALTDMLPPVHGWAPTLRIADFEVADWVWRRGAKARMAELLRERLMP